jgi:hypothetical protein
MLIRKPLGERPLNTLNKTHDGKKVLLKPIVRGGYEWNGLKILSV